jgi:drug/metabolite transporter (DMT)-like permease
MELYVFLAVLFGAACHAGWNAFLKLDLEPTIAMALIGGMGAVVVLPLLPFVGLPDPAAWPWLLGSAAFHFGYFICLTEAYRTGDLGQVYPIARGSAPLLTATATALLFGENTGIVGWAGIAILSLGVLLLSLRGGRSLKFDRRAVGFALLTAVTICGYSLLDGMGGRAAGNPLSYTAWLFIADGAIMVGAAYALRGRAVFGAIRTYWRRGLIGASLSVASYGIAIWAMTVAPIALVAALRETSVLFAALIAVVILKEPLRASRMAAAVLIVCGLIFIRVAG